MWHWSAEAASTTGTCNASTQLVNIFFSSIFFSRVLSDFFYAPATGASEVHDHGNN
jgi:hypothetical protein